MAENTYQSGNTIKLKCTFTDFDDALIDPDLVKVIIYDQKFTVVGEYALDVDNNRESIGRYFYNYTIPSDTKGKLYYEWYCENSSVVSLKRGSFKVSFI